ncbi:MAG: NAD(+) synthase, partial [Desulfobulbaceae bacterium]|nr:NAD(+) synthase [Desulfobulbaceae bacterium]
LNYLVLGTGNKSEIMIGYYTKYGDGGVDLEPLGALYKSEVYQLAEYLGVPKPILTKAPTAGLWEQQTDEDEMGMTYDTLEKALRVIENNGLNEYDGEELAPDNLDKVQQIYRATRHKREMPPSCKLD